MECLLCHGEKWVSISQYDRHGHPLQTRLCAGCGLICNHPIPDQATLERFYKDQYRLTYKGAHRPRKRQIYRNFKGAYYQIIRLGDAIKKAQSILDLGSGSGEFLYLMKILGKTTQGIEPYQAYVEYCRKTLDLNVTMATLRADLFASQQFDFIRANHVLEHMASPVEALRMIRRWLAKDGVLHLEVPDIEHYCRSKSVKNIFHFGHIFNFNFETLVATAGLAGFKPVTGQERSTSLLFRPAPSWIHDQAQNKSNVAHLRQAIDTHYAQGWRWNRVTKTAHKLGRLLNESYWALRLGTPQKIGQHFAHQLNV